MIIMVISNTYVYVPGENLGRFPVLKWVQQIVHSAVAEWTEACLVCYIKNAFSVSALEICLFVHI